jgi:hypothetical protein
VAAFTDEMLMAYADGALDAEAGARIAALIKADPEARARVLLFRATGKELSCLCEGVLREPVPAHLTQFVMTYGKGRAASPAQKRLALAGPARLSLAPAASSLRRVRLTSLWAGLRERLIPEGGGGWQLAAASALALIVAGAGAGFLLRDQDGGLGPGLSVLRQGQILASGPLHQVLESLPSNEERAAGSTKGATAVRAVLTFRTKEGGYCREYELATAQGQFGGLACRQAGGDWAVEVHAAQQAQATGMHHPVGHGERLDQLVDGRMEGDAFGEAEEKAAIKNGWK